MTRVPMTRLARTTPKIMPGLTLAEEESERDDSLGTDSAWLLREESDGLWVISEVVAEEA